MVSFIETSGVEFYNVKIFYYDHTTPVHEEAAAHGLKGQGMSWTHNTMNSSEAFTLSEELIKSVKHAPYIAQHSGEIWEIAHFHERGFSPAPTGAAAIRAATARRARNTGPSSTAPGARKAARGWSTCPPSCATRLKRA